MPSSSGSGWQAKCRPSHENPQRSPGDLVECCRAIGDQLQRCSYAQVGTSLSRGRSGTAVLVRHRCHRLSHRPLSRSVGCANPGCCDLSRPGHDGQQLRQQHEPEARCSDEGCGRPALGPQRESPYAVPNSARPDGQESGLDIRIGRCSLQQGDVMASIQRRRKQAKDAGNLKTTQEIKVVQESSQTIVIQPANPQVVYVPQYNPTVVYGTPYNPPGYNTAALVTTGLISFEVGMAIGSTMTTVAAGLGLVRRRMGLHGAVETSCTKTMSMSRAATPSTETATTPTTASTTPTKQSRLEQRQPEQRQYGESRR